MSDERRKRNRIPYQIPIRLKNTTEWTEATCNNLSMSGMSLQTTTELAVGDLGDFKLVPAMGTERIEITGEFKVVHVQEAQAESEQSEFGVVFNRLDDDSSLNLYQIIRQYDAI